MKELAPLLHLDCLTVTGRTAGGEPGPAAVQAAKVIAPLGQPLAPEGGTAILRGNSARDGAVIKQAAASPALLRIAAGPWCSAPGGPRRRIDDPTSTSADECWSSRTSARSAVPGCRNGLDRHAGGNFLMPASATWYGSPTPT